MLSLSSIKRLRLLFFLIAIERDLRTDTIIRQFRSHLRIGLWQLLLFFTDSIVWLVHFNEIILGGNLRISIVLRFYLI